MRGFLLASLFVLLCGSMEAQMLCESPQGQYRECRVGSAGVLVLVGELSEGRCVEGATWGTVSTGVVWVDRGCRGRFMLRDSNLTPGSRRVVCESEKGDRQVCAAELEQASSAQRHAMKTRRGVTTPSAIRSGSTKVAARSSSSAPATIRRR